MRGSTVCRVKTDLVGTTLPPSSPTPTPLDQVDLLDPLNLRHPVHNYSIGKTSADLAHPFCERNENSHHYCHYWWASCLARLAPRSSQVPLLVGKLANGSNFGS